MHWYTRIIGWLYILDYVCVSIDNSMTISYSWLKVKKQHAYYNVSTRTQKTKLLVAISEAHSNYKKKFNMLLK